MTLALVTGAGGFAGGYLCEALLQKGYHVRAMVRRRSDDYIAPKLLELQKRHSLLHIVRGDVTNFCDVFEAMTSCHQVYHLASQSYVPDSVKNPSYSFQTNVIGISNILEAARHLKSFNATEPRILFASSSEVYGKQSEEELPLDENSVTRPASPYATSKLFGEHLCKNYHDNYGINVIITRAFNHEGRGRGHHFVTAKICRQLIMIRKGELERLTLGDTRPERDWTHASDVVNAYTIAMEKGAPGETYVVGSGQSHNIREFISMAAGWADIPKLEVITDSALLRPNDVPRLRANPSKMKELGWERNWTLTDIMLEMLGYYDKMTSQERAKIEEQVRNI